MFSIREDQHEDNKVQRKTNSRSKTKTKTVHRRHSNFVKGTALLLSLTGLRHPDNDRETQ